MAYQVNWYMGHRIIYALIEDDYFSAKDLAGLNDTLVSFIRHSNSPSVHVIIDASAVRMLPFPGALQPVFAYLREPQLGLISSSPPTRRPNTSTAWSRHSAGRASAVSHRLKKACSSWRTRTNRSSCPLELPLRV